MVNNHPIKWPVARRALNYLREIDSAWIAKLTDVQPSGRRAVRFWQRGGGYDRNINRESTLYEVVHYIHDNPTRRGLVEKASDWYWSSAEWYENRGDVPLAVDNTLPVIQIEGTRKYVRP